MGVPALEVGYTSTTTGRGDHEVYKKSVATHTKEKFKRKMLKIAKQVTYWTMYNKTAINVEINGKS
jgi:hypothetical protein